MANKLTSITGFGEGDPKRDKSDWALGGSHAPSRNWGSHKDKTGKRAADNAKNKAIRAKTGGKKERVVSHRMSLGMGQSIPVYKDK